MYAVLVFVRSAALVLAQCGVRSAGSALKHPAITGSPSLALGQLIATVRTGRESALARRKRRRVAVGVWQWVARPRWRWY